LKWLPVKRLSTITSVGEIAGESVWERHGRLIGGIIGGVVSAILVTWAAYYIRKDNKQKEVVRNRTIQVNDTYGLPFTTRLVERAQPLQYIYILELDNSSTSHIRR
jgi:hypothetical protein